ncbi:GAF domain-containing protein [Streptomyces chrestomyceticus]|uniref:GAF domain-containing protein n=1 Tax=Streptomyces chrestomyceticus TaxID=68185 RepID=UPI0019D2018C|nr:GAF domain-containing protein [Streptomyces chrestomyceticus]
MTPFGSRAARLVRAAARERDDARLPQRLCAAIRHGLPVDDVSLCLATTPADRQLLAATGPAALRLEEVQYETGEGPGPEAADTGRPVLYPDVRAHPMPYPFFAPRLHEELGHAAAVFAFPLNLGPRTLATADCLRYQPLRLDDPTLDDTMQVLEETAAVLADRCLPYFDRDAPLPWRPARLIDDHWGTTYRAAGALAGLLSISVSEALARLRASAFTTGRPLPALAREVLRRYREGPHEEG